MEVKHKIKVLECIRQGQIGGGESHLISLSENLNKNIFEPVVLSFTDGPMVDLLRQMNIDASIIYTEKPFNIFIWKKVRDFIKAKKIDLVHAHGTRANSNVYWAARSLKIPLVYSIHGWSFHDDQPFLLKKISIFSENFLTSKSTLNISVSESNKQTGLRYIKSFASEVINNGINQAKFNPLNTFKKVRKELGINEQQIVLLFIARFTAHKQPLALIRAFAIALQKMPGLQLLMVGEGDEKDIAVSLAKELSIQDNVIFEPFRQDVPDVLNAADIFILPSLWEGLPIGLLEAMSMGKAVIASDVDGTCEIIKNDCNGCLITLNNLEKELAEKIVLLANNASLRQQYGSEAIKTVQNRFNAAAMTRQIEDIYIRLLK